MSDESYIDSENYSENYQSDTEDEDYYVSGERKRKFISIYKSDTEEEDEDGYFALPEELELESKEKPVKTKEIERTNGIEKRNRLTEEKKDNNEKPVYSNAKINKAVKTIDYIWKNK